MRATYAVWSGLVLIAVLAALATKYYAYFPGDLAVTQGVQSLLGQDLYWASWISGTAKFPWLLLILAIVLALAWPLAGWRAALAALLSLGGMLALGAWLGPAVARPRPSAELVQVFRPFTGFGFPSLFALRYAATLGFLMLLVALRGSGPVRTTLVIACAALLLVGGLARVALGAHWPSDVAISYYLGLLWAAALIRLVSSGPSAPSPFLRGHRRKGRIATARREGRGAVPNHLATAPRNDGHAVKYKR